MKRLLHVFCLIPLLGCAQNDTIFNTNKEILSVNQIGVHKLIDKYKLSLIKRGGVEGWRVQIKFTSKREDILPYQVKFARLYPEVPAIISFESPYYKLTIGNFRTRNEALKISHLIKRQFPGAYPVAAIIDTSLLKD